MLVIFCSMFITCFKLLCGIRLCSRVCGNPHAIIRKYGLMCCRQCFRSNAKQIGFIKVYRVHHLFFFPFLLPSLPSPTLFWCKLTGFGVEIALFGVVIFILFSCDLNVIFILFFSCSTAEWS